MTTQGPTSETGVLRRRSVSDTLALWGAKLGAAFILGRAAVTKLVDDPVPVEIFNRIGMGDAGRYLIGGLEIVAAIPPDPAALAALANDRLGPGAVIDDVETVVFAGVDDFAAPPTLAHAFVAMNVGQRMLYVVDAATCSARASRSQRSSSCVRRCIAS